MLGYYKKTRESIAKIIRRSPSTPDGYHVCKNFREMNKAIGENLEKRYMYTRDYFENKICFNQADIEAYLEDKYNYYDIDKMKRRDDFLYDIIKDEVEFYDLKDKIEDNDFTLEELIDCSLFVFNNKYY